MNVVSGDSIDVICSGMTEKYPGREGYSRHFDAYQCPPSKSSSIHFVCIGVRVITARSLSFENSFRCPSTLVILLWCDVLHLGFEVVGAGESICHTEVRLRTDLSTVCSQGRLRMDSFRDYFHNEWQQTKNKDASVVDGGR